MKKTTTLGINPFQFLLSFFSWELIYFPTWDLLPHYELSLNNWDLVCIMYSLLGVIFILCLGLSSSKLRGLIHMNYFVHNFCHFSGTYSWEVSSMETQLVGRIGPHLHTSLCQT